MIQLFVLSLFQVAAGTNAISEILKVPRLPSNSVLEAYVPYAKESLDHYLLRQPDRASHDTTLSMAAKAYSAAKKIDQENSSKKIIGYCYYSIIGNQLRKKGRS